MEKDLLKHIFDDESIQKLIDECPQIRSLIDQVIEEKLTHREALHRLVAAKLQNAMQAVAIEQKPLELNSKDIVKKEEVSKKGSPLKEFLERKKKPKEYKVEMSKSEIVDCPDCGQTIFGKSGYSGCICMGQDQHKKIWIKKNDNEVQLRFSRGWDQDNIVQLLEILRKSHGQY